MDKEVSDALDAIRHEAETARGEAAAAHMLAQDTDTKVTHIEQMLSSAIKVDNANATALAAVTAALGQIKDDLTAMRNAKVGPPANAAPT